MVILLLGDILLTKPTEMLLALNARYMVAPLNFFNRSGAVRTPFVPLFVQLLESLKCHARSATRVICVPLSLAFEAECDFALITGGLVTAPPAFYLAVAVKCGALRFVFVLNRTLDLIHFPVLLRQFVVA